jgi:hypothetical protein
MSAGGSSSFDPYQFEMRPPPDMMNVIFAKLRSLIYREISTGKRMSPVRCAVPNGQTAFVAL